MKLEIPENDEFHNDLQRLQKRLEGDMWTELQEVAEAELPLDSQHFAEAVVYMGARLYLADRKKLDKDYWANLERAGDEEVATGIRDRLEAARTLIASDINLSKDAIVIPPPGKQL